MKPCKHEDDESCSYTELRKEDPNKIAKRLSEYVDERNVNANEYDLEHAEDYWTDDEGLAWDSHHHFRYRIVEIATDMRTKPEIEMIKVFTQKYFSWLEECGRRVVSDDTLLRACISDSGLCLHDKTIKMLKKNIDEIVKSDTRPPTGNMKGIFSIYVGWIFLQTHHCKT